MPQTIDPEFWLNLSEDKLKQPDIVSQIVNMFDRPASPESQTGYLPHIMQQPVFTQPDAPVPPEVMYPNVGNDYPPGVVPNQVTNMRPRPAQVTPQPSTAQPSTSQQQSGSQSQQTTTETQTQTTDGKPVLNNYEDYLKLFQQTLGNAPELDKKRRNQLAIVAGINALGNAIKQVVNLHDRNKYGSPATPQVDQLTPALLSQYEKEYQDYMQRKDRYDLQKTNTMQEAMRYAYGDEQQRKASEERWKLYGEEKKDRADERASDRKFQKDLYEQKIKDEKAMYDQQVKDQATRDEILHGYDMEKFNSAKNAAEKSNAVAENELKLAGENVPVIDQKTGRSIIIPKELYWDIYQKIMNNPTSELDKQMQKLDGADYEQSKNIINGLIAAEYQKYYEPKYDSAGQFQGWMMKDPNAPASTKEYKTFWDYMPVEPPEPTLPSIFQRK